MRIMDTILERLSMQAPGREPGDSRRGSVGSVVVRIGASVGSRRGFTLTELLVAVSIVLVLMSLIGGAVAAARGSQKKQATALLIARLDEIIKQQYSTYASKTVDMTGCPSGVSKNDYRAWFIRRNMITGDMPDRWTDVRFMAQNASQFVSGPQRAYIAIWNSLSSSQQTLVMANNASAECLFMIVMMGGIADCLDCGELRTSNVGDQDGDGMPEFLDAWGNPIGYLLWAPALELPAGSGQRFFSGDRSLDTPWVGTNRATLGMRPLIYSGGADGLFGYDRQNEAPTLNDGSTPVVGANCGSSLSTSGGRKPDEPDARSDNITNFDEEARRSP